MVWLYLYSVTRLSSIHQLVMHQQAHCVRSASIRYLIRRLLELHYLLISEPYRVIVTRIS